MFLTVDVRIMAAARQMRLINSEPCLNYASAPRTSLRTVGLDSTILHISIPYTGSVQVCFFHQTSLSSCTFFLGGQEMSKLSDTEGLCPTSQTAPRCRVWQCLIFRGGIPVNLQGGLKNFRHSSAINYALGHLSVKEAY